MLFMPLTFAKWTVHLLTLKSSSSSWLCSHAIVSSLVGPEYYVNIMSFVDKSQLEPGCSILLHNKVSYGNIEKILSTQSS